MSRLIRYSIRILFKAFDAGVALTGGVSIVLLCMITAVTLYEVVMRYFLNRPTLWAMDYGTYMTCILSFLGASWVLKSDGHVSVGTSLLRLNPRLQTFVSGVASTIGCLASGLFSWQAAKLAWEAYQDGIAIARGIYFPKYLILGPMAFGAFLFSIQFARKAYLHFWRSESEGPKPHSGETEHETIVRSGM